jgi:uncharacterized membrane protein
METAAEVQLEDSRPTQGEEKIPRTSAMRVLGIFFLVSVWMWGAFLRRRIHSGTRQLLFLLGIMAAVAGLGWLVARILRRRFMLDRQESIRILVFASSAFLLLAIFIPEFILGRPPLVRSMVLLGFSLLLFAAYVGLYLRKENFRRRALGGPFSSGKLLFIFCLVYFVAASWVSMLKLHAFGYVGQDVAYFTQCLYTTLHGHLFYSNMYHDLLYSKAVGSDFAGHNQPVLFIFLPFYLLHKSASTLLIVRNIFVVLCAWPIYLIGRRSLTSGMAAILAIAFLFIPAVLYQNLYDFAPFSLAALPLLFAFYYFLEGRFIPYVIAIICTQLVREDLVFAVFGLGLLALWQRRSLRWVLFPCTFALFWAFLTWKIIFPYFLQGASSAVGSCFAYLGTTAPQALRYIIGHPAIFLSRSAFIYVKQMVDSFGGVLFLGNPLWLLAAPYVAINLLGQPGGCNSAMIYRHYALVPTVLLFGSLMMSVEKMARKKGQPATGIASAAVVLFVLFAALSSTVSVTGKPQFDELQTRPWHREASQIAATIPADASVAVPRYLLPSVANRSRVYQSLRLLEYHHPDAEYIIVDKDWQRVAATEKWRENYEALRHLLETSPQYRTIYDSSNYAVYKLCDGCTPTLAHRAPVKEIHD